MGKTRTRIDHAAVDEAAGELGLSLPVRVTGTRFPRSPDAVGFYLGIRDGAHRISVDTSAAPRAVSRILWHELTHALQAEALGGAEAFWARSDHEARAAGLTATQADARELSLLAGWRYRRLPVEREAIRNERRARRMPLARAANVKS